MRKDAPPSSSLSVGESQRSHRAPPARHGRIARCRGRRRPPCRRFRRCRRPLEHRRAHRSRLPAAAKRRHRPASPNDGFSRTSARRAAFRPLDCRRTIRDKIREWSPATLAHLFAALITHDDAASRRWLLTHGLSTESTSDGKTPLALHWPRCRLRCAAVQRPARCRRASRRLFVRAADRQASRHDESPRRPRSAEPAHDRTRRRIFATDAAGAGALALSVAAGCLALARELLARGLDPNARDHLGRTPLFACLTLPKEIAIDMIKLLIGAGANPEVTAANGETPMGLALARPNRRCSSGSTGMPGSCRIARCANDDLLSAAACGDVSAVSKLLGLGFAIDSPTHKARRHCCAPPAAAMPTWSRSCSTMVPMRPRPPLAAAPRSALPSSRAARGHRGAGVARRRRRPASERRRHGVDDRGGAGLSGNRRHAAQRRRRRQRESTAAIPARCMPPRISLSTDATPARTAHARIVARSQSRCRRAQFRRTNAAAAAARRARRGRAAADRNRYWR